MMKVSELEILNNRYDCWHVDELQVGGNTMLESKQNFIRGKSSVHQREKLN